MKKKLTVLIFLLFLTSPLIIHYNGTEFQFQGKAHGKEYCEEDDACEEEGEEDEYPETVANLEELHALVVKFLE